MDQNARTRQHYISFKYELASLFFEDPHDLLQRICKGSTTLPTLHLIWSQSGKNRPTSEKINPSTVGLEYINIIIDEKFECMTISLADAQHRGEPKYISFILSSTDASFRRMFVGERFITETDIDENRVMLVQITPEARSPYFPAAVKNSVEFTASCVMVISENKSPTAHVSLPFELINRRSTKKQSTQDKPEAKSDKTRKADTQQLRKTKRTLVWAIGLQVLTLLFWATQIGQEITAAYVVVSLMTTIFAMWSIFKVTALLNYQSYTTIILMVLVFLSNIASLIVLLLTNHQAQKALAKQRKEVGFFEFI